MTGNRVEIEKHLSVFGLEKKAKERSQQHLIRVDVTNGAEMDTWPACTQWWPKHRPNRRRISQGLVGGSMMMNVQCIFHLC